MNIKEEADRHRISWPVGCGVKTCDVCASVGKGRKDDAEKPRYDLIPFKALDQVVGVLTYGAQKYAPENWRKVEGWRWRYLAASLRHLTKWASGEKIDPESGHPHLAHALCCLFFLAELDS